MRKLGKQSWEMLVAGAMSGVAWAPISWWPLGLMGWAWWMISISHGDQQRVFLKSMVFTMTSWIIAFHWLAFHPIMIAATTSVVALFAFSCLFAAVAATLIPSMPESRPELRLIAGLISLLVFEIAISWGPFAMPSLSAGFAFTPSAWAMSLSSWAGIKGLSAAVGLSGALGAWLLTNSKKRSKTNTVLSAVSLLAFIAFPLLNESDATATSDPDLTIQLVQPNSSPEAWSDVNDIDRVREFDQLLRQTDSSLSPADLTVLPETALPLGAETDIRRWIAGLSNAASTPILSGGIEVSGGPKARNVAYLSSDSSSRHAKVRLVPFAEHVPFSNLIPGFDRLAVPAGGVEGYEPGAFLKNLTLPMQTADGPSTISVVPLICFESLFFRDARSGLLDGGRVSVVITQDGWWGSNRARSQHRAFSQLLAAATGHPVVHATVDGESALIGADGTLMPLQTITSSLFRGQLPLASRTTAFMRAGNAPFFGIFGALVVLLIILRRRDS